MYLPPRLHFIVHHPLARRAPRHLPPAHHRRLSLPRSLNERSANAARQLRRKERVFYLRYPPLTPSARVARLGDVVG